MPMEGVLKFRVIWLISCLNRRDAGDADAF